MQIRTTLRYQLLSLRLENIKNLTTYSYDMAVEKPALTHMAGGNADGTALEKGICQYLKPSIYLPFVPEIPLLGIYVEDISPSIQKSVAQGYSLQH